MEATKFTEVGYVGRDVESIIRDLMENAVRMVRNEFSKRVEARASVLAEDRLAQPDLFADRLRIEKMERAAQAVDALNARFGQHTISLGSALFLRRPYASPRNEPPWRRAALLRGETARRRLRLPRLSLAGKWLAD